MMNSLIKAVKHYKLLVLKLSHCYSNFVTIVNIYMNILGLISQQHLNWLHGRNDNSVN